MDEDENDFAVQAKYWLRCMSNGHEKVLRLSQLVQTN